MEFPPGSGCMGVRLCVLPLLVLVSFARLNLAQPSERLVGPGYVRYRMTALYGAQHWNLPQHLNLYCMVLVWSSSTGHVKVSSGTSFWLGGPAPGLVLSVPLRAAPQARLGLVAPPGYRQ